MPNKTIYICSRCREKIIGNAAVYKTKEVCPSCFYNFLHPNMHPSMKAKKLEKIQVRQINKKQAIKKQREKEKRIKLFYKTRKEKEEKKLEYIQLKDLQPTKRKIRKKPKSESPLDYGEELSAEQNLELDRLSQLSITDMDLEENEIAQPERIIMRPGVSKLHLHEGATKQLHKKPILKKRSPKIIKYCLNCGISFRPERNNKKYKFCGKTCSWKYWYKNIFLDKCECGNLKKGTSILCHFCNNKILAKFRSSSGRFIKNEN